MMEEPKLVVTEDLNDAFIRRLYIENYKASYVYHILIDGCEETYDTFGVIIKGEGKHSVSVTVSRNVDKFEFDSNTPDSYYDKGLYDSARTDIEVYIDIPYSIPANVISLKHNTYDTRDPDINPTVNFEVWTHPFMQEIRMNGASITEAERIPHGDYRYLSYTYTGSVTRNCILSSTGRNLLSDGETLDSNLIYKVSDWTFEGENTKPINANEMQTQHSQWYNMYNDLIRYKRDWNIENWNNDIFKDLLGYYKYKNPNNNIYYESAYRVKEYRTVDTFLDALEGNTVNGNLVIPEILGIDEEDETQMALYPGVVRGANQYYAAWIDGMPFELNDRTELTSGDIYKNSTIRVITQSMRRNAQKVAISDDNRRAEDTKSFRIDTAKPQFPQVNIDLESVMRNPFLLDSVKEGNDIETRYQLRRIIYKYYSDDPNELYNYEHIKGDCKYELVDFTLGDYVWEDGDYLLDVWNYRHINKVFRHRSFYFTVNTLKNMDVLPLRAKIIPLKIDNYQISMDGEMLLDWITGDYYINVDGVIKSATVTLNKDTSELEETEFQRLVDAADYMDMLEDDIQRYNANKGLIEEAMKDIIRLLTLYKEYMRVIEVAKRDTAFDCNYIEDIHKKLRELYKNVSIVESYLKDLDSVVETDKKIMETVKNTVDNEFIKLDNIGYKIEMLKNYTPIKSGTEMFKEFIADTTAKQLAYVSDKINYKPDTSPQYDDDEIQPDVYYTIKYTGSNKINITNYIDNEEILSKANEISILEGSNYRGVVEAKSGYTLNWISLNGVIQENTITIPNVSSDIEIQVSVSDAIEPVPALLQSEIITITRYLTNAKIEETSYPNCSYENDGIEEKVYLDEVSKYELNSYLAKISNIVETEGLQVHIIMDGEDCTNEYYNYKRIRITNVTGDIVITADGVPFGQSYDSVEITNTLVNCHNTSLRRHIAREIPYKGKLVSNKGYTISPDISIIMAGEDITIDAYNFATGDIYIPKVTGPIQINATADIPRSIVQINSRLFDASLSNPVIELPIGSEYYTKVQTTNSQYNIVDLKVIMGNKDITEEVYDKKTNEIYIPMLIDNLMIIATVGMSTIAKLRKNLIRTQISNETEILKLGEDFNAKIAPEDGYYISYVLVTDNEGKNLTDFHYKNGTLAISNISKDMNIIAVSDNTDGAYIVEYNLVNADIEDELEAVEVGSKYTNKLYPHKGYYVSDVQILVNNGSMKDDANKVYTDITDDVYNKKTHEIVVPFVTGDIKVNMVCEPVMKSKITLNLIRVFSSNTVTSVPVGELYQTALFGEDDLEITFVKIINGDNEDVTDKYYHDGRVYIPSLNEDITITAVATK